jgi:hypothetical protein
MGSPKQPRLLSRVQVAFHKLTARLHCWWQHPYNSWTWRSQAGAYISWVRWTRPARMTLQQDLSAHIYWESLIAEAKRPRAQNWCCLYRLRRGMSHTRIGYALSLICMFLIWLATLCTSQSLIIIPHLHVSRLIGYTLKASLSCPGQAVSLQKTLLLVQTYAWWPVVVSTTLQRHMWLPTGKHITVIWLRAHGWRTHRPQEWSYYYYFAKRT